MFPKWEAGQVVVTGATGRGRRRGERKGEGLIGVKGESRTEVFLPLNPALCQLQSTTIMPWQKNSGMAAKLSWGGEMGAEGMMGAEE